MAFLDVILLALFSIITQSPSFHDKSVALPKLSAALSDSEASGTESLALILRKDGRILWRNDEVPLAGLVERIAAETGDADVVRVEIETDEQGNGPVDLLLEISRDAARAGIWKRFDVPYRSSGEKEDRP